MNLTGHNKQTRSVESLSASEKEQIKKAVMEMDASMIAAAAEKEMQKNIIDDICGKTNIDKKIFRKMSSAYFKANYDSEKESFEAFDTFYQTVVKGGGLGV